MARRTWFGVSVALLAVVPVVASCSLLAASRPMLPLGPARTYNQPYQPCAPGLLSVVPMQGPIVSQAFELDANRAQGEPAAPADIVSYEIGGHRPLAAESLHVTVPIARATLHAGPDTRLFVDGGGGVCIAEWRVSAHEVAGFDGRQESGATWRELGSGRGQGDAVVVGGVPAGDWIVHIHLAFGPDGAAHRDTTDSYARVVTRNSVPHGSAVPSPELVAPCGDSISALGAPPAMVLSTDGTTWTSGELAIGTDHGGPGRMPAPSVPVVAGSLIRVRTADGSCGNDWGGAIFSVVPQDLSAAFAGAGLEYNNGSDPNSPTNRPVGGLNAIAPAAGEWLFSVVFFFGDAGVATYYWRISVR